MIKQTIISLPEGVTLRKEKDTDGKETIRLVSSGSVIIREYNKITGYQYKIVHAGKANKRNGNFTSNERIKPSKPRRKSSSRESSLGYLKKH